MRLLKEFPVTVHPFLRAAEAAADSHFAFENNRFKFLTEVILLQQLLEAPAGLKHQEIFADPDYPAPSLELLFGMLRLYMDDIDKPMLTRLSRVLLGISKKAKGRHEIEAALRACRDLQPEQIGLFRFWGMRHAG